MRRNFKEFTMQLHLKCLLMSLSNIFHQWYQPYPLKPVYLPIARRCVQIGCIIDTFLRWIGVRNVHSLVTVQNIHSNGSQFYTCFFVMHKKIMSAFWLGQHAESFSHSIVVCFSLQNFKSVYYRLYLILSWPYSCLLTSYAQFAQISCVDLAYSIRSPSSSLLQCDVC